MVLSYPWNAFFASSLFGVIVIIITLWDWIWRGIALWRAGNKKQLGWFICLLIFNTIGILPIVYLVFFQGKKKKAKKAVKKKAKKSRKK